MGRVPTTHFLSRTRSIPSQASQTSSYPVKQPITSTPTTAIKMPFSTVLPMYPPPRSILARYRLLSPTASVRVSPICLGGMSFGDNWADHMGSCDQETTEAILDEFYNQGGNFIDTSNNYQFQQSEKWIGEWMKKRGNRNEIVLATKYSTNYLAGEPDKERRVIINHQGNGSKSLHVSVADSLKRLQTDYLDLLYVHWWDFSTSIPELMQSLNSLVVAGKVLYLGISDSPAWVVSKANEYARNHGLRQFSVYQGLWNAATRDLEREVIPMCQSEGMGIAPWGTMGSGAFKTEEQRQAQSKGGRNVQPSETDIRISRALEAVAKRHSTRVTSVAMAYVMAKTPYVFPIVGCRTVDHLKGNIEALSINLSGEDIKEIEGANSFDPGFPMTMLYGPVIPEDSQNVWLMKMGGTLDPVLPPKAIKPQ
ncbi:aldo/keto reductase [Stachybotrys elegans]|uniref:Aldo/keto reductase n=1 Tax=Stachybotrys elegans TaxID=80388 RepID=A0A8K0SGP6_9HYPO|nr:aldo/keto reductase [Stachybotrys elegans]